MRPRRINFVTTKKSRAQYILMVCWFCLLLPLWILRLIKETLLIRCASLFIYYLEWYKVPKEHQKEMPLYNHSNMCAEEWEFRHAVHPILWYTRGWNTASTTLSFTVSIAPPGISQTSSKQIPSFISIKQWEDGSPEPRAPSPPSFEDFKRADLIINVKGEQLTYKVAAGKGTEDMRLAGVTSVPWRH